MVYGNLQKTPGKMDDNWNSATAEMLVSAVPTGRMQFDKKANMITLLENIKLLGNLYDFNMGDQAKQFNFQDFLDDFENISSTDNLKQTMFELTTPCEEMIKDCMWSGKKYNCDDLFKTRMTYEGICCVFNYIRPLSKKGKFTYATEVQNATAQRLYHSGIENGLKATLINNIDDYFLTTLETRGYTVQIFYPKDYPDQISGSLSETIVEFGSDVSLGIDVDVVKSSNILRALSYEKRTCMFDDEESTVFGSYRHSDCLVECKIRLIATLCNCIPFTIPTLDVQEFQEISFCTLMDLPCLNRYKTKMLKYYPTGTASTVLNGEKQDSMGCSNCVSNCNNIVYKVSTNLTPLLHHSDNDSRLNVFFNKAFGNTYRIDLSQTWFELISNIGGFLSLFMGISIISAIEVVILVYRLVRYYIHTICKI
ncbi:hypothetical protein JTB14_025090 [Gonioctena quinquepunctata]|nr:hypothetical protein JTB14_025090 [Gonioctena quinquepunctata]